jgi:hypothetical protein
VLVVVGVLGHDHAAVAVDDPEARQAGERRLRRVAGAVLAGLALERDDALGEGQAAR